MKKNVKKSFILSILLCIFITVPSFAKGVSDNQNINLYIKENLKKSMYKPGDSDDLKFTLENNSDKTIKIKNLYFTPSDDKLNEAFKEMAKYTNVIIKNNDNVIIEDLLENLLGKNKFNLNIEVRPHENSDFDMYIDIDSSMGNEAQNVYQKLNINTNYEIYNNDDNIHNDNNNNNNENNNNNGDNNNSENSNSGNQSNQNSGQGNLPSTGDSYDYSVIILFVSAIMLLFVRRNNLNRATK